MKFIFILIFGIVAAVQGLNDEKTAQLKKWHMECFNEIRVNPDLILKLSHGYWGNENFALKKWVLCLLVKYDLMSNQGVFKLDTALSLVPPRDREMIEDYVDECIPKTALPPFEIAWQYAKCYHTKQKLKKNRDKKLHYLQLFYD